MKIGGLARYYAEPKTKEELEEAIQFAEKKKVPVIPLGAGSNTVFANGTVNALILRIGADDVVINDDHVTVCAGKYLAVLINELAEQNLDLSPLTGIPGTIGGAIFGNAGQGFGGVWIDTYIHTVDAYFDHTWHTLSKEECRFAYRTSRFKDMKAPIIWSCTLRIPSRPKEEVKAEVERLLQKRIETQPHVKTAGSCFLSVRADLPAWKLIDGAGLRGTKIGDCEVSTKHANFLINSGNAKYEDLKKLVMHIQSKVDEPMHVEMRFVEEDGTSAH